MGPFHEGWRARIRLIDVRDTLRVLFIKVSLHYRDGTPVEGTCRVWMDEGFWNGEEPSGYIPEESVLETSCGENEAEVKRLLNNLMP